jgi:hypothetical protein
MIGLELQIFFLLFFSNGLIKQMFIQSKLQQHNKHTTLHLNPCASGDQPQHIYPHSQSSMQQFMHSTQARAAQIWERTIAH